VARHTKAESGKLNDAKRVQSVRVCVRQRGPDGAKERPQDATLTDTHTHTHGKRRLLASLLRLPKKSAAQIVQIFWLCHAHKLMLSPLPLKPLSPPPLNLHAVSFLFAGGPNNNWGEGG